MLTTIYTLIVSFVATTFLGHILHWMLHQSWAGKLNQSHMVHHLKLYPTTDYQSETYRDAGKDSTTKFFLAISIPLVVVVFALYLFDVISLYKMVVGLLFGGVVGYLHDYLHDAFHIKNHWLTRIPFVSDIFDRMVKLHYIHHDHNMEYNFGIYTFFWDRIFRTFKNTD